jgi:Protein of unknown function (DUF2917)
MIHWQLEHIEESVMEHVLMRNPQHFVAPGRAWLRVKAGTLWVTRSGDPDDHVLGPGEQLAVGRGDDLVLQAWRSDVPARWHWQPQPAPVPVHYRLRRALPAWAWARFARTLRGAADGLAALARSAAARASRAQGCISVGDSIAAGGAVQ